MARTKINNIIREQNSILVNFPFKIEAGLHILAYLSEKIKLKDSLSFTFILVPANFLPFGREEMVTPRLDNGSSEAVALKQPFKFFGHTHNKTFVSIFQLDVLM